MKQLETDRLIIREAVLNDAPFLLKLMNQPSYHEFIGDRGLKTEADAAKYIQTKFIDNYRKQGYGLFVIELKEPRQPIGINGLVKREDLVHPDIGFASLDSAWGKGYALESSQKVLEHAKDLGYQEVLAITSLNNSASIKLLERVGFIFDKTIRLGHTGDEELRLFRRKS